MNDAVTNFMRYSKGTVMLDDFHSISRPRECAYYRYLEYINDDMTANKRHTRPAIINFTWEQAQDLATTDPPRLYHVKSYTHPNGEQMTNEQTVHRTLQQAHEKRLRYEAME